MQLQLFLRNVQYANRLKGPVVLKTWSNQTSCSSHMSGSICFGSYRPNVDTDSHIHLAETLSD